jgi:hypothetical protein
VLVDFADGAKPATTYLESFVGMVARPFCLEAGRHPADAPRLVFHAENDPSAREYDCEKRALGRALPPPTTR